MPDLWLMSSSRVCWNLCIYHVKDSRQSLTFHFLCSHTQRSTSLHLCPKLVFWTQLEFLLWNLCNARLTNKRMVEGFTNKKGGIGWRGRGEDEGQGCQGRDRVKLTLFSFQELSGSGKGVGVVWQNDVSALINEPGAHTLLSPLPPSIPPLLVSMCDHECHLCSRAGEKWRETEGGWERAKQEWWVFGMRRNGWRSVLSCLYLE